jgi:hypothetical protein
MGGKLLIGLWNDRPIPVHPTWSGIPLPMQSGNKCRNSRKLRKILPIKGLFNDPGLKGALSKNRSVP